MTNARKMMMKGTIIITLIVVITWSTSTSEATLLKVISLLDPEQPIFSTECKWNRELIRKSPDDLEGLLVHSYPKDACSSIGPPPLPPSTNGSYPIEPDWILMATWNKNDRCTLLTKVTLADKAGYSAVVIQLEEEDDSEANFVPEDEWDYGLSIYPCLVSNEDGHTLWNNFTSDEYIIHFEDESIDTWTKLFITTFLALIAILLAIALSYCVVQMFILLVVWIRDTVVQAFETRRLNRRRRLPSSQLRRIPVQQWTSAIPQDMCTICLENYVELDKVRVLPCSHVFHMSCIDPWLLNQRRKCPNCKRKIVFPDEPYDSDSSTEDERTPLIRRAGSLDHSIAGGLTFTFNESDFANQQQPIYRAIHRMMLEANARQRAAQEQRLQNQGHGIQHYPTTPSTSTGGMTSTSTSHTGEVPSGTNNSASNAAILQHAIRHHRLSRFCPRKRLPQSLFSGNNNATRATVVTCSANSNDGDYLEDTSVTVGNGHNNPNWSEVEVVDHVQNQFLAEATQAYEDSLRQNCNFDAQAQVQLCDETVANIEGDVCDISSEHDERS